MYFLGRLLPILTRARPPARPRLSAVLVLVTAWPTLAAGQTTLSTELTAPRNVDVSVEFLGSVARRSAGGFEWYLTDLTFGVTPRLEIGAGWSALVPQSADRLPQRRVLG